MVSFTLVCLDSEKKIVVFHWDIWYILGTTFPLEEGMATHSSILVWRSPPLAEVPGRLYAMGSQIFRHNWATQHSTAQEEPLSSFSFLKIQNFLACISIKMGKFLGEKKPSLVLPPSVCHRISHVIKTQLTKALLNTVWCPGLLCTSYVPTYFTSLFI